MLAYKGAEIVAHKYWLMHERLKEYKYSVEHALMILRRINAILYDNERMVLTEIGAKEKVVLKGLWMYDLYAKKSKH